MAGRLVFDSQQTRQEALGVPETQTTKIRNRSSRQGIADIYQRSPRAPRLDLNLWPGGLGRNGTTLLAPVQVGAHNLAS